MNTYATSVKTANTKSTEQKKAAQICTKSQTRHHLYCKHMNTMNEKHHIQISERDKYRACLYILVTQASKLRKNRDKIMIQTDITWWAISTGNTGRAHVMSQQMLPVLQKKDALKTHRKGGNTGKTHAKGSPKHAQLSKWPKLLDASSIPLPYLIWSCK